ncbi:dihydrofolate reductase family protein [Nioella sp. MMSF_3534]|uniref:dihydrofolate reductase family protein n=1 Tax=Nioella sp. MMSF_3534 TaxID=3046720 RepID=UPI00273FAEAA|nr:dihydrofolate reductase family protein [Nioella sp. MMSF_3534]
MHPVIYDVAVSVDGYISGPEGDISGFAHEGPVVEDYVARLAGYATAIMGRGTYEFGYRFGMEPGQNPYGHMRTHVYSERLNLPEKRAVILHRGAGRAQVAEVIRGSDGPVYLCGGGAFAGALLGWGLIDRLRVKRAPIVLGGGTRLFGGCPVQPDLRLHAQTVYDGGYLYQDFEVIH